MSDQTITKTDFRTYLDCPLHFWAFKHGFEPIIVPTAMDEFRIQQGQAVEVLALEYLQQLINNQYLNARLEWQRTIMQDLFLARADGLIYDEEAKIYDLYEVKSGTEIKREDLFDIAFQMKVLASSLPLRSAYLLHLNKEYHLQETLNLAELFIYEDVTQAVAEIEAMTEQHMLAARQVLLQETSESIEHCRKPDDCPFPDLCHPNLPEHSIYEISRLHRNKAMQLEEMGVHAITEIPADFTLSDKQLDYVEVVKSGQPYIDQAAITEKLSKLCYPLYFLDYETCNPAIPVFEGYKPNQHIVFQFSLHVLSAPDAEVEHHQFLHTEYSDPAPALLEKLSHTIQTQGSIIAWNKGFECSRNREMGEIHSAYTAFLDNINNRVFDLMETFSQNLYIHPDFHGSASIKKVLPVLVPELSYDGMEIAKGDEASIAWWKMVNGKLSEEEKEKTINAMLKYCQLDTLAMYKIYQLLS